LLSAAHVAVTEQVPVPLVILTDVPLTVQGPVVVIVAVVLELVSVDTLKDELYGALYGTPNK
jgi:hypothetical protein